MVKFFLCIFFISSITAFADIQVQNGLVSAELQSQPLMQVLDRLKAQTDIHLVIDDGVPGRTISASFQDLPVAMALKKMLEGTGINYAVLAGNDGTPDSVFISVSSHPGAPPRRLDNRPITSRSVVTPVNPPAPVPQAQPENRRPNPETRGYNPNVNVPTGGGFAPQSPQSQQPQNQEQPQQQDDNSDNNEN
jgi:hypothetical protein